MKRILSFISVVGVLGVTVLLIYSLATNFGKVFPKVEFPKVEFPKVEFPEVEFPKVEFPKVEFPKVEFPKVEFPKVEFPKVEFPKVEFPRCDPFDGMDLSLVILSIREDIMVLPVYMKTDGDVPGMFPPDGSEPWVYHALLGDIKSNSCGLQVGFDDRIYCMFTLGQDVPGQVLNFQLYREECEDFVFMQPYVSVPELQPSGDEKPQCKKDLGPKKCEAAGGSMSTSLTTAPYCICP